MRGSVVDEQDGVRRRGGGGGRHRGRDGEAHRDRRARRAALRAGARRALLRRRVRVPCGACGRLRVHACGRQVARRRRVCHSEEHRGGPRLQALVVGREEGVRLRPGVARLVFELGTVARASRARGRVVAIRVHRRQAVHRTSSAGRTSAIDARVLGRAGRRGRARPRRAGSAAAAGVVAALHVFVQVLEPAVSPVAHARVVQHRRRVDRRGVRPRIRRCRFERRTRERPLPHALNVP
mmetsp:Transcript_19048/g.59116  ORF Transcript_19048/g.59116 Transcript_19048/m.59116 type:complete len:238 (+) Transcript_19048:1004-1717(+)